MGFLYAARILRRSRGFTVTAVTLLALGIGAVTATFSVVNKVLLEPLPYADPERLVQLMSVSQLGDQPLASIPKYVVWRDTTSVFEGMAACDTGGSVVNLADGAEEPLKAVRVSAGYFQLLGVRIVIGRSFTNEEDKADGPTAALISERLWRRRFGADPRVVGRHVRLDGARHKVVGVIAGDFPLSPPADIWLPLQADPSSVDHVNRVQVIARLKAGIGVRQARDDVGKTMEAFLQKFPPVSSIAAPLIPLESFTAIPLRDAVVGDIRPALYLLTGAVGFVLLLSCANAASLFLARASRRASEFAVRAALGAQRKQIVVQLLTESLLLSLVAGAVGLGLGYAGVRALMTVVPADVPRIGASGALITLDWRVFLFTLVVSMFTGVVFGLAPALSASRTDLNALVKDRPSESGMGFRRNRTRPMLVVMQIALAIVLLVGAGLLIRTFVAKRAISRGFDEHNVLTLEMSLSSPLFEQTEKVTRLINLAEARLQRIPGVAAIGTTSALPLQPSMSTVFQIFRSGDEFRYDGSAAWRSVSPGYFSVFRIRLLRGRLFTEDDDGRAAAVVQINRAMLRKYWGDMENPIGEFIIIGKGARTEFDEPPRQIIGVVADVKETGLDSEPAMYVPASQVKDGMNLRNNRLFPLTWVVRTDNANPAIGAAVQQELLAMSGGRPLGRILTMHQVVAASSARIEFTMTILTVFAVIALLLAGTGIYSLMAYSVQQRTQEISIRIALGAQPADVRSLVVSQGMWLVVMGIVIGIPAGLALARVTLSLVFGIKAWDPVLLGVIAMVFCLVALVAAYIPSGRAIRVNPAGALRC